MIARPRHIVFLLSGLGAGGAEKVINLIARHRADAGDTVSVLALNGHPVQSFFPYADPIRVRTCENEAGKTSLLGRLQWLRRTLADLRPDLVVSFLTKVNVLTLLASLNKPWPVIVSERNNPQAQPAHPLWPYLTRATLPRAQAIVMQTEAAKATLLPRAAEGAHVIGNPCTLTRARAPVGDAASRFVAVGRLADQKGFDTLIDAFAYVHQTRPDATLTIYGEGPLRDDLQSQITGLNLNAVVHLPGLSTSPGDWIDQGDSFVLSSRYEGFPNVLAEAMAAGMAAISTRCDWGPPELIADGENGLLVPTDDPQALGSAMLRVLQERALRERLATSAKASAATRFTLSSILDQWDQVIDSTLASRTRRARQAA
nr:glycosyltransferase [Cognatishimia sp. MH4019]